MDVLSLIETGGLLAFAGAVLMDLRLLRVAYQAQAIKVAVIEARIGIVTPPFGTPALPDHGD